MRDTVRWLGGVPGGILFGDLVFLNGAFYGATGPPNSNSETPGAIYRFNLMDLSQSERVVVLPEDVFFLAMTVVWDEECKEQKIVGNDAEVGEFDRSTNTLYEVDLESGQITPLCEKIDFGTVSSERIWGLTSSDEFRTNCRLQLDLDVNDNSGRLIDHFLLDSLCTTVFPIADDDVRALSMDGPLDSIVVEVVAGIKHVGEEFLEVDSVPLFEVKGLGTTRLSLHNRGQAQLSDLEEAVRCIRFHIAAGNPQSGERKLFTRLYVNGEASDPAKSFLRANFDEQPSAGEDAYVETCEYRGKDLFLALGGNPRPGGRWQPELSSQTNNNFFLARNDAPGIYQYIVKEGGCAADTAEVEVVVFPDPNIGLTDNPRDLPTIDICRGDSIVWDPTFEGGHSYFWTHDRSEEIIRVFKEEGFYQVDARDTNNCVWNGAAYINVLEEGSVRTEETVLHCLAEPYQWQGQAVTRDTLICESFPRENGCDSTHCVNISIQAPEVRSSQATICSNETYSFGSRELNQSGNYQDTVTLPGGCERIDRLDLQVLPAYEIPIEAGICSGGSVEIAGQAFSEPGLYQISLTTAMGCDSILRVEVKEKNVGSIRTDRITSCNNNPVRLAGVEYTQDTVVCDTFINIEGCDSIRCVELFFFERAESVRKIELCEGESISIKGKTYDQTGRYIDTLLLPNGCDSFALTELIVHPTYETHLDSTIKPGQEVAIGDQRFAFPGRWEVLLESRAGCDSLIVLKLEIDSTSSVVDIAKSEDYWSPGLLSRSSGDRFMIYARQGNNDGRRIHRLELYNAWGQGVFVGHNLTLGATSEGWPVDRGSRGMYFFRAFLEEREDVPLILTGRFVVE